MTTPTTPYAKLTVALNGGSPTSGAVVLPPGAAVQFSAVNKSAWEQAVYTIKGPLAWTVPAGWTTVAPGIATYTGSTEDPPAWSAPTIAGWGKWVCELVVNGTTKFGKPGNVDMTDVSTILVMDAGSGLTDEGTDETTQIDLYRGARASTQKNLRLGGGGWITALDLDYTAQPTQSLGVDGAYTIGGVAHVKTNSANEASTTALTQGTGIVIHPASSSDLGGATRTLPALAIALASIIPNFSLSTPVRIWLRNSQNSAAADFDGANLLIEDPTVHTFYQIFRGHSTAGGGQIFSFNANVDGSAKGSGLQVAIFSDDVLVIECPMGAGAGFALMYGGTYASGFPAPSALNPGAVMNMISGSVVAPAATLFSSAANCSAVIGAERSGSGTTAFTATFARIRVDYRR